MSKCGFVIASWVLSLLSSVVASAETPSTSYSKVTPESNLTATWIAVRSQQRETIPPRSRIVIAEIAGYNGVDCAQEVKDALVRRLLDNSNFEVLSRDDLGLILFEGDEAWGGRFNTATAPKLGELLAASYFVVGRVSFCGTSFRKARGGDWEQLFSVYANLQVIDSESGKVVFASASQGTALVPPGQLELASEKQDIAEAPPEGTTSSYRSGSPLSPNAQAPDGDGRQKRVKRFFSRIAGKVREAKDAAQPQDENQDAKDIPRGDPRDPFLRFRAADNMVNQFADKFLGRPLWEKVTMWQNDRWRYGASPYLVKLGDCPRAVTLLEGSAKLELPQMVPEEVAEYLHNYGVALLCVGKTKMAMKKLRSAYRIRSDDSTLKMQGLAARIEEWSLVVEVDVEAEVEGIRDGDEAYFRHASRR